MPSSSTAKLTRDFHLDPTRDIRNVHGAPGWFELSTDDPETAVRFVEQAYGWEVEKTKVGNGDYWVARVCGHEVGGIRAPLPGATGEPTWITYVTAESVDAVADKARSVGGTVVVPPTDVPGAGRFTAVDHPAAGRTFAFEYPHPFE